MIKQKNTGKNTFSKTRRHNLFWGSSYDRGLMHILRMWPKVIEKYPEATFHCYYGWNLFMTAYRTNPERMDWKDRVDKLMKQKGITHHGRVGQPELRKAREKCGIWAYPTDFDEINCCSGNTHILMPRDHREHPYGVPIKELEGKSNFLVYSYDHKADKIVLGTVLWVKKTRKNAKLLKITLDDGTVLKFTPDHRFMLRDGTYMEAKKLKEGQGLMPLYERPTFMIKQPSGLWEHEHRMVVGTNGEIKGKHVDHKDGDRFNNDPDNLVALSPSEHAKKTFTGRRHSRLGKEWLKNRADKKKETVRQKKFYNHKILSIEEATAREDVYDMEVKKYHNFNAGGVFVHNCITALESQRDGCVPCVINRAALKETVGSGVRVEGDIYDPEVQEEYLKQLLLLMGDEKRWKAEQDKGKEFAKAFAWDKIAKQWDTVFKK